MPKLFLIYGTGNKCRSLDLRVHSLKQLRMSSFAFHAPAVQLVPLTWNFAF